MTANPTLPNRTGITAALVPTNRLKTEQPENGWDQDKEHYYENGTMAISKECSFQVLRQTAKTESGSVLMKTVIYVSGSFSESKARKSAMTGNTVAIIMKAAGKFTIFQPNQSSSMTESEM